MIKRIIVITVIVLIAVGTYWYTSEKTDDNTTHEANNQAGHLTLESDVKNDDIPNYNQSEAGLNEMTLDEKIGQMIFSGVNGTEMTPDTKNLIESYHVGGIILFASNIDSPTQTVDFLNDIKVANKGNPHPLILGVDEEGGSVTRLPDEMKSLPKSQSIGKLNNTDLSYEVGTILGKQVGELGFNLDFSPVMDVNSNPNNPVISDRAFGDDPHLVSKLGIQTMKGIQSQDIISVIKHFPGHGDTGVDSHLELPKVDKSYEELANLELIPFKDAIENGADVSMIAHILLPQIDPDNPASMSNEVITNDLRGKLDFDGVVITDDLTMQAITNHYDIGEAALTSVKAGSDLMLVAHDYDLVGSVFDILKEAVESGELSEERIDESVKRIQSLKEKYGITGEPTDKPNVSDINKKVETILEKVS